MRQGFDADISKESDRPVGEKPEQRPLESYAFLMAFYYLSMQNLRPRMESFLSQGAFLPIRAAGPSWVGEVGSVLLSSVNPKFSISSGAMRLCSIRHLR